jgi:hypothetical protein
VRKSRVSCRAVGCKLAAEWASWAHLVELRPDPAAIAVLDGHVLQPARA